MNIQLGSKPLLMLIDLQKAIDDPSWGVRNNPEAEANIVRLLTLWRERGLPILHVKHMSTDPNSTYRPDRPSNAFKPETAPYPDEEILEKQSNSAFIGTNLDQMLKQRGLDELVIVGVITNNSVEATVRMAGNLGYLTFLVADGTFTFGRHDYVGQFHPAERIHNISLANMDGEYATVVSTTQLINTLQP